MSLHHACAFLCTFFGCLFFLSLGLEDADLHPVLSFATFMNDLRAIPSFDELKKKIASLEPENLLSQVQYCSLMSTISTFAHGKLRWELYIFNLLLYYLNNSEGYLSILSSTTFCKKCLSPYNGIERQKCIIVTSHSLHVHDFGQ